MPQRWGPRRARECSAPPGTTNVEGDELSGRYDDAEKVRAGIAPHRPGRERPILVRWTSDRSPSLRCAKARRAGRRDRAASSR